VTRARRTGTAAAVLATAAALLLGGCGSSHHSAGARPAASGPAATAVAPAPGGTAPGGSPAPSGTAVPGEAPGSAADAPKVPDSKLTPPGGGTFTAKQKRYLSGRVPEGTDPDAVLEGGQEICDRLTRTAKVDPDAAASAIVSGDISLSGATAAVTALCPDQRAALAAARRGFADGGFTVAAEPVPGRSVAPGGYHAPAPSPSCSWQVVGAKGTVLAKGSAGSAAKARLTVPAGAVSVHSAGCYAWLPDPAPTR
jgi:hypothetical protein